MCLSSLLSLLLSALSSQYMRSPIWPIKSIILAVHTVAAAGHSPVPWAILKVLCSMSYVIISYTSSNCVAQPWGTRGLTLLCDFSTANKTAPIPNSTYLGFEGGPAVSAPVPPSRRVARGVPSHDIALDWTSPINLTFNTTIAIHTPCISHQPQ